MFVSRLLPAVLSIAVSSTAIAQSCLMGGAAPLWFGTQWAAGPNVYNAYVANPAVGTDIVAAQDAWDATNAADRLAGWTGGITASDCPVGQPRQVGAFSFSSTVCAAVTGALFDFRSALAFVDYYQAQCAQCGAGSISVNLDYAWAVGADPLPGQYHLRSVLAHEFGHMLGLAHMNAGACGQIAAPSCAISPGRETMGMHIWPGPGETCEADVAPNDANSAATLY